MLQISKTYRIGLIEFLLHKRSHRRLPLNTSHIRKLNLFASTKLFYSFTTYRLLLSRHCEIRSIQKRVTRYGWHPSKAAVLLQIANRLFDLYLLVVSDEFRPPIHLLDHHHRLDVVFVEISESYSYLRMRALGNYGQYLDCSTLSRGPTR